jgi:hypothetical protein
MNLKDVVIKLDINEVRELLEIDMDSNAAKALAIIQGDIIKKIRRALEAK